MKDSKSNLLLVTFAKVLLFFIAVFLTGCGKTENLCADINCQNGGDCVDGTCQCPTGFSGTFCEIADFQYPAGKYFGGSISIGNGSIRTWADVDEEGNPITIGASFHEDLLDSLPDGTELYSIPMPEEAHNTLFDHLFFGWEPHGHGPFWVVPHFDFHFVMVSDSAREAVNEGPDGIPLNANKIPQDYVSDMGNVGFAVARMGVHWWDSTAPDVSGLGFTSTLIYGAYHGVITFMEPMIAHAYLLTKPTVTFNIKQPPTYQSTGYWPTTYSITYHANSKEYDVTLQGFVKRTRG